MEAGYVSTIYHDQYIMIDASTVDDVAGLIRQARLESGESAVSLSGGAPAVGLSGFRTFLSIAPVDSKISLNYGYCDGSRSFTSRDPNNTSGDDDTYWFFYNGSASELPQRFAVPEDLAMAAVAQFLERDDVLPQVPGLEWEQD